MMKDVLGLPAQNESALKTAAWRQAFFEQSEENRRVSPICHAHMYVCTAGGSIISLRPPPSALHNLRVEEVGHRHRCGRLRRMLRATLDLKPFLKTIFMKYSSSAVFLRWSRN